MLDEFMGISISPTSFVEEQAVLSVERKQVSSLKMDLRTFAHFTFSEVWTYVAPPPSKRTFSGDGSSLIEGPLDSKLIVGVN